MFAKYPAFSLKILYYLKMRKIYIARRIKDNTEPGAVIPIHEGCSKSELAQMYADKQIVHSAYIHNGHWIMRPVVEDKILTQYLLPQDLSTEDVLGMVKQKIEDSDAFVAFISREAYGTIFEIGYAVAKEKAVYVLPTQDTLDYDKSELWMSFAGSLLTAPQWRESDIKSIPEFDKFGIISLSDYEKFIKNIIPSFLKK